MLESKKSTSGSNRFFFTGRLQCYIHVLSHSHFHPNKSQSQGKNSDLIVTCPFSPNPISLPFCFSFLLDPLHTQQFLLPQGTTTFLAISTTWNAPATTCSFTSFRSLLKSCSLWSFCLKLKADPFPPSCVFLQKTLITWGTIYLFVQSILGLSPLECMLRKHRDLLPVLLTAVSPLPSTVHGVQQTLKKIRAEWMNAT